MTHTKPLSFRHSAFGDLHLGNYIGAIRNWWLDKRSSTTFSVWLTFHAITVYQHPEVLRTKIRETVGVLLALGLIRRRVLLFIQSHVTAHTTWHGC